MTYASTVLADSPLIYWRLGEPSGTSAADSSGNGRTGTYSGSPTLGVTGLIAADANTAVQFDGVDDYVTATDTTDLTAYTIEAWVKTSTAGNGAIAARRTSLSNMNFQLGLNSGAPQLVTRTSGGGATAQAPGSIADGQIHHIVGTFDTALGSNQGKLYVDGTQVATATNSGTLQTTNYPFYVGVRASDLLQPFTGVIDEVAYYTTALSAARVAAHYAAGIPVAAMNVTPTFTAANTHTYAPTIEFGDLAVAPGFTAANTQTFPPSVAAGAERNITVTAAVERGRWRAAVLDPDRTAEVQPPRHRAGVTP